MSEGQVIDGEVMDETTEIVPAPAASPASIFRTDDPVEVLEKAQTIAKALAPVIREAGLVSKISGKEYLKVEAWQTLGQQVGVTGVITSTTRIEGGWEARCEARTLDGRVIGAAESMCLKEEERWKDSEDFEIRSMAQTRAMSRALASPLRFIPTLAGMGGTPAEEMDRVAANGGNGSSGGGRRQPSDAQLNFFERLAKDAGFVSDELATVMAYAKEKLSSSEVSKAIDGLKDKEKQTAIADDLQTASKAWGASQSTDTPEYEAEKAPEDSPI